MVRADSSVPPFSKGGLGGILRIRSLRDQKYHVLSKLSAPEPLLGLSRRPGLSSRRRIETSIEIMGEGWDGGGHSDTGCRTEQTLVRTG
jgi:hypothetical protein